MGCDYYVKKFLEITHTKGKCYFQLNFVRCYFSDFAKDCTDTDDDFSEEEDNRKNELNLIRKSYVNLMLKPRKPRVLYSDGKWSSSVYETKYKTYVDTFIEGNESPYNSKILDFDSDYDSNKNNLDTKPENFGQIISIIKKETREEN